MAAEHYLVIRLIPDQPVKPEDFRDKFLAGLSLRAWEMSFGSPQQGDAINATPAEYPPPAPGDGIYQHFAWEGGAEITIPDPGGGPDIRIGRKYIRRPRSVATAIIKIPNNRLSTVEGGTRDEYQTLDLRLEIKQNGQVDKELYFNVGSIASLDAPSPVPDPFNTEVDQIPDTVPSTGDVIVATANLHIVLQSPGTSRGPLPPPPFASLRADIRAVLSAENPGANIDDLEKSLTPKQAEFVAQEIEWNSSLFPKPTRTPDELNSWFTGDGNPGSGDPQRSMRFRNEVMNYVMARQSDAQRLATYVYAIAAAVKCQQLSKDAPMVRFEFPRLPDADPSRTESLRPNAAAVLKG